MPEIPFLTSLILLLPLAGALVVALVGDKLAQGVALLFSGVTLALTVVLALGFDPAQIALGEGAVAQFVNESGVWMPGLDVRYRVGVDGLSLLLVLLTALVTPLAILGSARQIVDKQRAFYSLMLLLQAGVIGVFVSFDLFLFYICYELVLIPSFFLIGIWGDTDRQAATTKFVIYTLVGSLPMLAAVIWLGLGAGEAAQAAGLITEGFTTDWYTLVAYDVPASMQYGLAALFLFAFAIKAPLFPLHSWLPDTYRQAPTGATVMIAALLGKMGTYGILRFCLPLFPTAMHAYAPVLAVLATIGILYGAFLAYGQRDMKRLVAFSSISHLGFILLGLFAFTQEAVQGAVIQMFNHGITAAALFLLVGMLFERRASLDLDAFGGWAKAVPILTFFMLFSVFASAGLPGLNGFVGEFLILLGSYKSTVIGNPILIGFATLGVVFAAVYLLYLVYSTFFGPLVRDKAEPLADLSFREVGLLLPLVILMIWVGMGAAPFLDTSERAVAELLDVAESKRLAALDATPGRSVHPRFGPGALHPGASSRAARLWSFSGAHRRAVVF